MQPLSFFQHSSNAGQSTLSNLLASDFLIANLVNVHKSYDIDAFDFQRAFDKVPHHPLLEALKSEQIHKTSLKWIASFLSRRTQQVIVNGTVSSTSAVASGIVQGSVLEPIFSLSLLTPYCSNLVSSCQDHRLHLLITSNLWQRQVNKVLVWHSVLLKLLAIGLLLISCF